MKHILITGIAGFIGSKIAELQIQLGNRVTGIDNLKTGYRSNVPTKAALILGDCADKKIFEHNGLCDIKFDVIIHFAGQSSGEISFDDPVQDLSDNCISTLNLLEYAKNSGCKNFIFASSMSVYGQVGESFVDEDCSLRPLSMYAVGKLASEHYLRIYEQYEISSVSLRLFNTYGPGQNMANLRQGMISIYAAQAIKNKHILVKGSPDRYRDFIHVDDVSQIVSHFVRYGCTGSEIYNVSTGVKSKVSEVIDLISDALSPESLTVDYSGSTPGDQFGIVGDNSKLLRALKQDHEQVSDYAFIDIRTGIIDFIGHLTGE